MGFAGYFHDACPARMVSRRLGSGVCLLLLPIGWAVAPILLSGIIATMTQMLRWITVFANDLMVARGLALARRRAAVHHRSGFGSPVCVRGELPSRLRSMGSSLMLTSTLINGDRCRLLTMCVLGGAGVFAVRHVRRRRVRGRTSLCARRPGRLLVNRGDPALGRTAAASPPSWSPAADEP